MLVNGVRIHYEIQGDGEPLVLLMGLGAYSRKWARHVAVYKQHFQCILVDNRGSGQSDKPKADFYTTEEMAEDTIGVLNELGVKRAHFHGISMGGAVAQIIAARYPERVKSLVLTSTFAKADVYFTRALEILRDSVGVIDGTVFSHLCQYMIYSASYHEQHLDAMLMDESEDTHDPYPMPTYAYKAQCNACIRHDSLAMLSSITAPTLVTAGSMDLFVSQDATRKLVNGIPNAKLLLCESGGHAHHWEQPERFNQVTLDFMLSNCDARRN